VARLSLTRTRCMLAIGLGGIESRMTPEEDARNKRAARPQGSIPALHFTYRAFLSYKPPRCEVGGLAAQVAGVLPPSQTNRRPPSPSSGPCPNASRRSSGTARSSPQPDSPGLRRSHGLRGGQECPEHLRNKRALFPDLRLPIQDRMTFSTATGKSRMRLPVAW
jgi:hypothetical protein